MKFFSLAFLVFFLYKFSNNERETLILNYSAFSCSCAQWHIEESKKEERIYLEKENEKLININEIWDGETLPFKIKVSGNFKKELGYPKDYKFKGEPKKARVFVYSEIIIME